jgi:hypothetical protein
LVLSSTTLSSTLSLSSDAPTPTLTLHIAALERAGSVG